VTQESHGIVNSNGVGGLNERNFTSLKLPVQVERVRESILWTLNSLILQTSWIPWHGQVVPVKLPLGEAHI